jgi:hypothetical protein
LASILVSHGSHFELPQNFEHEWAHLSVFVHGTLQWIFSGVESHLNLILWPHSAIVFSTSTPHLSHSAS